MNKNLNAENKFAMIEAWKDQVAIDSHNRSEHFTTIVPQLGGFENSAAKVSLYNKVL
ncbi:MULTISPECIES: putative quinol monooxygenase [unclassified Oceanispirochaeta]|uniref:putative quinol monooxygenase n=1 Tax=unclassified Oceanispirochaeta TaxID=2635722 RepID=UPI002711D299|nr:MULTISPECIES: antibiotic biosynthesis monooxygenase [unclassified Oceanispirochaeta]